MKDLWTNDLLHFTRREKDKRIQKRCAFLRKWACWDSSYYPFIHNVIKVNSIDQRLDPLIVPLINKMNTIEGVKTLASCQGTERQSPYVYFAAPMMSALRLINNMFWDWHDQIGEGWYWNNVIIMFAGGHNNTAWMLHFYDLLTLMKFTKEYLGITIAEQIVIPKEFSKAPIGPTVEDFENVISSKE